MSHLPIRLEDVPEGEWVVLSPDDRVISHDTDLHQAIEKAERSGEKELEVMRAVAIGTPIIARFAHP